MVHFTVRQEEFIEEHGADTNSLQGVKENGTTLYQKQIMVAVFFIS